MLCSEDREDRDVDVVRVGLREKAAIEFEELLLLPLGKLGGRNAGGEAAVKLLLDTDRLETVDM